MNLTRNRTRLGIGLLAILGLMMLPITAALADHRGDHDKPTKPQNPPCDANHSNKSSAPFGKCGEEGPPGAENCTDGVDNDGDGLTDADDPGCQEAPPGTEGPFGDPTCDDDLDNDEDGAFDEDDSDCAAPPTEGPFGDPTCDDDLDNDEDGAFDEDDSDCAAPPTEGPFGDPTCSDLADNDGDGLVDADDPGCKAPPACDNGEAMVADVLTANPTGKEDGSQTLEGALASNVIHTAVEPLVPADDGLDLGLNPRNEVHTVNCRVVVVVEDTVDETLAAP